MKRVWWLALGFCVALSLYEVLLRAGWRPVYAAGVAVLAWKLWLDWVGEGSEEAPAS